eukprot:TRINITY_DN974_c0_g1_i2.p1 TRINITY_DN974_c0_g1~~TRINITY_DN974_c0_g1_i2.p1  ORF type:complete len:123 (+),score=6.79 TRINITY_DN974_c0_g1_i2:111-479(+)
MDRETDSIAKERQTSEALTEGLMGLLKPLLEQVDTHVEKTQATQSELGKQLDSVEAEMAKFAILQEHIPDVSASTQKLSDTKALLQKTISLVTSIEVGHKAIRSENALQMSPICIYRTALQR